MTSRLLAAIGLSASLLLAGCQNPDGSLDLGSTLMAGAGIGLAAALLASGSHHHGPSYARGYGGGGYRRG